MQAVQYDHPAIRVFLIVDHQILQWGLQLLIEGHDAVELVGSAASIDAALPLLPNSVPDVVLLDLDLNPAQISRLTEATQARVLVFTKGTDQDVQDKAVLDGARGVLEKNAAPETFVEAIIKVHQGQLWLDRAATGRIFVELSRRENAKAATKETCWSDALSAREKKILACILENTGAPARTLADKLHISESTLRNHLTSIYGKLGIANRFELISLAYKHGNSFAL